MRKLLFVIITLVFTACAVNPTQKEPKQPDIHGNLPELNADDPENMADDPGALQQQAQERNMSMMRVVAAPLITVANPYPDSLKHIIMIKGYENINASDAEQNGTNLKSYAAQGARFTKAYAFQHTSQVSYYQVAFGATLVTSNSDQGAKKFSQDNLFSRAFQKGKNAIIYCDGLPNDGDFTVFNSGRYVGKHNAFRGWSGITAAMIKKFTSAPLNPDDLPYLAILNPDLDHSGHDTGLPGADAWHMNATVKKYREYAMNPANRTIFITWFDESNTSNSDMRIFFSVNGYGVKPGIYDMHIDHFDVSNFVNDLMHMPRVGVAANYTSGYVLAPIFSNAPIDTTIHPPVDTTTVNLGVPTQVGCSATVNSIFINWTLTKPNSNFVSYTIRYSTTSNFVSSMYKNVSGNGTRSGSITGLIDNTTYYIQIKGEGSTDAFDSPFTSTTICKTLPAVINPPTGTNATAFRRNAALGTGYNVPWMESSTLNMAELPQIKTQIQMISLLGFKHVRIPVNFMSWGPAGSLIITQNNYFVALDSIYSWSKSLGLKVIFDMHGFDLTDGNWQNETNRITAYWKAILNRMKYTDPETVFFELMNEPKLDTSKWKPLITNLVLALRPIAPQHTFIVGATDHNSLYLLNKMGVLPDTNIIYTFHFYEPLLYTHAHAVWAGQDVMWLYPPYPYDANQMPAPPPNITPWGQWLLDKYYIDANFAFLKERIGWAVSWATTNKVPLHCGETGVYKEYVSVESRCRYTADIKTIMDFYKLPFTYWEWNHSFSPFKTTVQSITNIEPCLLVAMHIVLPTGDVCWRTDTVKKDTTYVQDGYTCQGKVISLKYVQIPCPAPLQPSTTAMARFAPTPGAVPDPEVDQTRLEALMKRVMDINKMKGE